MADVNDIGGDRRRHENLLESIEESDDIADADSEAILAFDDELDFEGRALTTRVQYLSVVRAHAEYSEDPVVELSRDDVERLIKSYASERDLANSTVRKNVSFLGNFLEDYVGRDWASDLPRPDTDDRTVSTDDIYTEENYYAMLDACTNARDKALVAVFWDSGLRVKAIGTLRVKDVTIHSDHAVIRLNDDAIGLKGASGERPLTASKPYLANWLNVHPRREDDDAPLWHQLRDFGDDGDAISHDRMGDVIRDAAREAGIDAQRFMSLFRHTSAARAKLNPEMSDQQIKFKHGWSENSDMLRVYGAFEDREMVDSILKSRGIVEDDEEEAGPSNCPQCGVVLEGAESFCPGCGQPLSVAASETLEDLEDDALDDLVSLPSDKAKLVRDFVDAVKSDPTVLDDVDHSESSSS